MCSRSTELGPSPWSAIVQLVLAVAIPPAIATLWVMISLQAGFHFFRDPTPQERAWELAGFATGIVGYGLLFAACIFGRRRWPVFSVVAGALGLLLGAIQLADLLL